jgi:hypothetical protein
MFYMNRDAVIGMELYDFIPKSSQSERKIPVFPLIIVGAIGPMGLDRTIISFREFGAAYIVPSYTVHSEDE